MSATAYFSATVPEADAKFAAAARGVASLQTIAHPLRGPQAEPLQVSVARIGPARARKVLLVLSGTHGIEGYAGAGIQTGLLCTLDARTLPADTALLLVHLINPWGMAWNRREDHENIDLFRNFLYIDQPCTPDPLFDAIDDLFDMKHYLQRTPAEHQALHDEALRRFGSDQRIIAAIRRGQHHRPKSMSYHGDHPCWSRNVLQALLQRELRGCSHLAVLDLHTGFGDYGGSLLMSYDLPGDARHERIRQWFDGDIYVPGGDFDIPAHAKSPYGFIAEWAPGVQVTAAIQEFGTFNPDDYRDIFPANHWHHVHGDPRSPEAVAIGARYRKYFYPEEARWMEMVWSKGADAAARMLRGLDAWSAQA